MSHLHLPDGVVPGPWLVAGYLGAAALLALAVLRLRRQDWVAALPRLGGVAGMMLLAMSIPLGFLPYHLNLTVLAGVVLGPWGGALAGFCVCLLLALVGHGGITVLGLNTLVLGGEAVVGWALYRLARLRLPPALAAGLATLVTLSLSMAAVVAFLAVALSGTGFEIRRFLPLALPFLGVGAVVEAGVVGALTGFLGAVRPDLLEGRVPARRPL
ncbi:MAG: energy-coupling factor ABC transporter permease [Acetobacteraceae bacterium]|nr:energy-coupling factor ABC transporter permease [Acetobacteraceae bacterium]